MDFSALVIDYITDVLENWEILLWLKFNKLKLKYTKLYLIKYT